MYMCMIIIKVSWNTLNTTVFTYAIKPFTYVPTTELIFAVSIWISFSQVRDVSPTSVAQNVLLVNLLNLIGSTGFAIMDVATVFWWIMSWRYVVVILNHKRDNLLLHDDLLNCPCWNRRVKRRTLIVGNYYLLLNIFNKQIFFCIQFYNIRR